MATQQWSNLPSDLLLVILKALDTDIDTLRLRSVCSAWRSSIPKFQKPFSFPLKLPLLHPGPESSNDAFVGYSTSVHVYCTLHESTLYRLSPPVSAGDPSNGWLFRVSETPNTFSLLDTLTERAFYCPLCTAPKQLNLLDYRISQVYKSYSLSYTPMRLCVRKVITLWNYIPDCDFAALALRHGGDLCYWRFGDDGWTLIDTIGFHFHDVILWDGVCYAVDDAGVLVSLDSQLKNPTVVTPPLLYRFLIKESFLVGCKSELCVVSKLESVVFAFSVLLNYPITEDGDATVVEFELACSKFSKQNRCWESVGGLGDRVFILGDGASACVSTKDFAGCKGYRVYLTDYELLTDYMDRWPPFSVSII